MFRAGIIENACYKAKQLNTITNPNSKFGLLHFIILVALVFLEIDMQYEEDLKVSFLEDFL